MWQNRKAWGCEFAISCLLLLSAVGCRTEIKSPIPSPYYLHDGPVATRPDHLGPEAIRAFEEYKLEREKLRAGVEEDARQ